MRQDKKAETEIMRGGGERRRQITKQTGRRTDWNIDRQTERQIARPVTVTYRQLDRKTYKQSQADRQRETGKHIDRERE